MRRKPCEECGKEFRYTYPQRFCCSSCAAKHNNRVRKESDWTRSLESRIKVSATLRAFYSRHPDKLKIRGRQSWTKESEKKMKQRLASRPKRFAEKSNGKTVRRFDLDISYGDYIQYCEEHPCCEICGKPEYVSTGGTKTNRLAIDHQHGTNHFRGLLCQQCNTKLGWFEKNRENVLDYLQKRNITGRDASAAC